MLSGCGQTAEPSAKSPAAETTETPAEDDTTEAEAGEADAASGEIKIVYTNDVHSYIDNVAKDSDGNVIGDGLRFSKIAAMVQDMKAAGENVVLVDTGDQVQGDVYGAMDEGVTIVDIMNATGYEVAAPGNHDFDYGMFQFMNLVDKAEYQFVSCNFHSTKSREIVLPPSTIIECGGKKIAFVGVTTPKTMTSSTPVYFQDENGEYIYTFEGINKPEDLFVSVQNAVDSARDKADYVVILAHLGVDIDSVNQGYSSLDMIANISGADAVIDGHSHTTMECEMVKDKTGKEIPLTQTGCYLSNMGVMTIGENGEISTELLSDYDREDETVAKMEQDWIQSVEEQMNEKIGTLETTLYINNPENDKERWIRAMELSMGDFTADSIYWFFNERLELDCDIAIQNGGGIRAQAEKGDLTYLSAKQVEPFGNMICLISATGQQIVDALEKGVTNIGEWDDEWNTPAENGGFMQVAGLSYDVDASVESSVELDENGMFKAVNGEYRVKNVKVYNKESGKYEPIDPEATYQLGGINYILRNGGSGCSMFTDCDLSVDYVGQDYVILAEYIKSFGEEGGDVSVCTKNSVLSTYKGYLIDYENPMGSGRINIYNVNYDK